MKRRDFIKSGAVAGAVVSFPNVVKAAGGQKIKLGVIGLGNRGTQVMRVFQQQSDVMVTALCDVYKPYLDRDQDAVDPKFREYGIGGAVPTFRDSDKFGPDVKRYEDYRRLLDDKNVDAVLIATPDH